ncbi:helix-turn-helix domain-containing protein [Embleya sp. NPDC020630]|uniref:helix-turn-helix domain-containing protein n=1 Tax=Embleya sp. NPDC020630 TaxID=3363979 RepID=UPI0037A2D64A
MEADHIRREDLCHLLTTCRARIDPGDVHLGPRTAARAPGLRQNDVASLAGVSLRWYATLERGDHTAPPTDMLRRVADALRMTAAERERLSLLACPPAQDPPPETVPEERYRELLHRLEPRPAALLDHAMNLVDATAPFRAWLGASRDGPWVNGLLWAFGPTAARRFTDVGRLRDTAVALARDLRVRRPFDTDVTAALESLLALPGIAPHWHSQDAALIEPVITHEETTEDGAVHEVLTVTTRLAGGWSLFAMYEPTVAGPSPTTP